MRRHINTRGRDDVILRRRVTKRRERRIIESLQRALNSLMRTDGFLRKVMSPVCDPVITKVSDDVVHVEVSVPMDQVAVPCQLKYQ